MKIERNFGNVKVLIIEDNPGDARLTREMLKGPESDFTIEAADRLGAGLDLLASHDIDIVLLDMGLPDSNGLEALEKLQTGFPSQPVVIMTGMDDETLGIKAVQLGAQDYLVKGQVDGALLRRSIKYAIERKRLVDDLKEKEWFLERLAELNPAVIAVNELTNNRQVYSSKSPLTVLGYSLEEIKDTIGFSLSILYPGDYERLIAAVTELKKAKGNVVNSIEIRVKAANGRWRWFQILYVVFKRD